MIRQILGEVSVPVANTEVQQVIENPGIVKTYLEKYMPSLISFLVQLVVAIVILLIGIKVIKSIVKIIKKGFDRSRMDAAVASFLANVIKYFLYFILVMALLSGFGVATGSVIVVLVTTGLLYLSILYGYLHFPLNSGFFPMFLAMLLLVLAAQGFAIFVTGIARRNRIALSFCGLWGVLSFSVSGFTFPVPAMPQLMQLMSDLFPMRHYYLLYVDQALNGIPMAYSWKPYLALVLFVLLPLLTLPKLKLDLQENRYLP